MAGLPVGNEYYASDYFQQLWDFAIRLIKEGKAYIDEQTSEQIAAQKGKNKERFAGAKERVEELQAILPDLAKAAHGYYFDVNTVVPYAQGPDEIHYTPENHAAIAKAMTSEIKKAFK